MRLINRDNGLFSRESTDEMNSTIKSLFELIDNYTPNTLEYKYNVLPIYISGTGISNSSFQASKQIFINFCYNKTFIYKDFVKIGTVSFMPDVDLYITGVTEDITYPTFKIDKTGKLFVKGICESGKSYCYFCYIKG